MTATTTEKSGHPPAHRDRAGLEIGSNPGANGCVRRRGAVKMIRALVLDEKTLFCAGLSLILDAEDDIMVVGSTAGASDVSSKAQGPGPDVIISVLTDPAHRALDVIREAGARWPEARFIVLSDAGAPRDVVRVVEAGARAFLLKTCSCEDLLSAVRVVHHGQSFLDPRVAPALLQHVAGLTGNRQAAELTSHEYAVLRLLAVGYTNKQIASALSISVNTVKTRLARIYEKLDVSRRTAAVARGLERRLITLD